MTTLTRVHDTQRRIVKVQRRVWLLQAALWSGLVLAGAAAAAAASWWARRRLHDGRHRATADPQTNGQYATAELGRAHG